MQSQTPKQLEYQRKSFKLNQHDGMNGTPAILGGAPTFSTFLPIVQPTLPPFDAIRNQISEVIATGMLTKGKYAREFEDRVAVHLGVKHAVAVSSCTLGLMLTYRGLRLEGVENIDTREYYDTPLHLHPSYRNIELRGPLAVTERITARSLPIYSHMDAETVDGICSAIEKIWQFHEKVKEAVDDQAA